MNKIATSSRMDVLIPVVAFFLLFLGIGRMFSLVTHDPLLGYANSYDMIRLQACHQIWPADKEIDITQGTPSAPLRRYTLEKHVETPCFPSSELVFTGTGIALAKLKNAITGGKLVSIKTIGFTKAVFLAITAVFASLYFLQRGQQTALLVNALVMLVVLSDPGVTLYLNTLYNEFSAGFFLYLALAGTAIIATTPPASMAALPLLAGLLGFGLSRPQYIPVALLAGVLVSGWLLVQRRGRLAAAVVCCATVPLLLQQGGLFVQQNDSMKLSDNINFVGSLLERTDDPAGLLNDLGLPGQCQQLKGKNGFDASTIRQNPCPQLGALDNSRKIAALLGQPRLLTTAVSESLALQKMWIVDRYGQVEGRLTETVDHYQLTLAALIRLLPDKLLAYLLLASLLLPVALLACKPYLPQRPATPLVFILLLALIQVALVLSTLAKTGLAGPERYIPLYLPLALAEIMLFLTATGYMLPAHHHISTTGE